MILNPDEDPSDVFKDYPDKPKIFNDRHDRLVAEWWAKKAADPNYSIMTDPKYVAPRSRTNEKRNGPWHEPNKRPWDENDDYLSNREALHPYNKKSNVKD
jgi:hypothetical protein